MNPLHLLKVKSAWDKFQSTHPKFPMFIQNVMQNGIQAGTVIDFQVTTPDGKTSRANLKITQEDMDLFQELKELAKNQ